VCSIQYETRRTDETLNTLADRHRPTPFEIHAVRPAMDQTIGVVGGQQPNGR
jgi:hypothetical protein